MAVTMNYSKVTRNGKKGHVVKRITIRGAKTAMEAGHALRRVNR